ncbi:unnamed protein product [Ceratitis capitata]|uniref:(Mediterranean fruit fly) hypothetical protein n=1 Tax=Ceratitis capitata TaxID=7213 RepID=A0A811VHY6_CERCA|nr:unnamed protein product [Ceratitis capitata]
MHPEKVTVWCGLWDGGIIGPYFFKDDANRRLHKTFFLPKRQELDLYDIWFQQDSAACHKARVTVDLLLNEFDEHFILRSGTVDWPPRSCDLTPLDYFLWSYVKSDTDKSASIDALEDSTEAFIREIPDEMLERVCQT